MKITNLATLCLLLCGLLIRAADGTAGCTFPTDLDGVFDSSHETSQMTFNSTHVYPFWVDTQSHLFQNLTFECSFVNGSKYIARSSDPIVIYTVPYYIYTCWEFTRKSSKSFVQFQGTTRLASAANLNYKIYPVVHTVDSNTICDVTSYTGDLITMLVKPGATSSDVSTCPVDFWGKYVYQMRDTTGTSYCDYTSWLDICSATNTLTINTTLCSSNVFYSTGGTLYCLHHTIDTSSGGSYYIYLYNADASVDSSTTYRFTCLSMYYSSAVTYMTQYPNECLDSSAQNSTYITTSPGGLYTMYANVTCPPTSGGTDLTIVIVLCVVVLVLIIIVVIIVLIYYKKVYLPKKRERMSSKVCPDSLPNTAMSGMTADKNYRMMFTPAPPRSAVPGRRPAGAGTGHHADTGSRAVSANSMRPTVSALATYRTPSPFITSGNDIDVDSLLDFDYTKQQLGDPDGAESGVLLEMEGSIPVYSEAGDTPEPTRITPMNSGKRY